MGLSHNTTEAAEVSSHTSWECPEGGHSQPGGCASLPWRADEPLSGDVSLSCVHPAQRDNRAERSQINLLAATAQPTSRKALGLEQRRPVLNGSEALSSAPQEKPRAQNISNHEGPESLVLLQLRVHPGQAPAPCGASITQPLYKCLLEHSRAATPAC